MKVDGITLLQKYKNKEIDKTTLLFYNDSMNCLIDVIDDMVIDEFIDAEFEILPYEEDKPIEELHYTGDGHADYTSVIPKINELVKAVNKLNKEMNK
jgi:hypothetical protein